VGHFVFEELDKDRNSFKNNNLEQVIAKVLANDTYIKNFKNYLFNAGLTINLDKNKALVNRFLAAEFARQLFGESQYYQIVLKEDKMIKAVLK
ncbi:MAG: peptidase S41, partial [Bacteroidota bacterium]